MKSIFLALLLVSASASASVSPISSDPTRCNLPSDQGVGSLIGKWESLPIRVVLDRDFYAADNGAAALEIKRAIATWNKWAALKGKTAFVIENDGADHTAGMDIPSIYDCSQATYTEAVSNMVGIWKISTYGDHVNTRESCGSQMKLMPDGVQAQTDWIVEGGKIKSSSILLNFDNFNAPGKKMIDVESLALHELGHVLGLLHSCNDSSSGGADGTSAVACSIAKKDYLEAVMFPFLLENEVRRNLRKNDYGRINCLY